MQQIKWLILFTFVGLGTTGCDESVTAPILDFADETTSDVEFEEEPQPPEVNEDDDRPDEIPPESAGIDNADDFNQPSPSCSDGIDNDEDGAIDFPQDPGCDSSEDTDETDNANVSVFDPSHPQHNRLVFDSDFPANNPEGSDIREQGTFRIRCAFSHFNYDDPIVFPNQPGAAHLHMYLGNNNVDHSSTTPESLRTSTDATCHGGPLNKTSYWVPGVLSPLFQRLEDRSGPNRGYLIDADGRPVPILNANGEPQYQVVRPTSRFQVDREGRYDENNIVTDEPNLYYKFAGFGTVPGEETRRPTQVMPAGLRMIAGVFGTVADPERAIRWDCPETRRRFDGERFLRHIPACRLDNEDLGEEPDVVEIVRMQVFFPSCWNGEDLDTPDHAAHLAYPTRHPTDRESHPGLFCPGELTADPNDDWVRLPRVQYLITYPVTEISAAPQLDENGRVVRDANGNLILGTASWFIASDSYRTFGTLHDPAAPSDGPVLPGGQTAHGDWFMAWNQEIIETWVRSCINEERHCANGQLGDGWRMRAGELDRVNDPEFNNPEIRRRGNGGLSERHHHH